MGNASGFPTQGEVIRFAYRVAGVLPEKHASVTPRGSTPAGVRKAITRLAQEQGKLEDNFGELMIELSGLVYGYVEWPPAHLFIGDVLNDFIAGYRNVLREEATYLDRHATVRWLIRDRWAANTIISLARNACKWKPSTLLPLRPATDDWFLPDFTERGIIWPMRKTLEWLYQVAGLTQTQFHYPGRDAGEGDQEKQRRLENAQNWASGRNLPSAAGLQESIQSAINERPEPITALSRPKSRLSAEAVLQLGRMSTAIWQSIVSEYGEDYAAHVSDLCRQVWALMMGELGMLERELQDTSRALRLSRANLALRGRMLELWNHNVAMRCQAATREIYAITTTGAMPTDEQYSHLIREYGLLPVETLTIPLRLEDTHEVEACFVEALSEWERLRVVGKTEAVDIDAFESLLARHQLTDALGWMPAWLRFQQAYRRQDYPAAWASISVAYELAKYQAGRHQYKILNHYVEMAARCGTHQQFVRGVNWARYVGHEVRWIRDRPLTEETLSFAKTIFQRSNYIV